MAEFTEVMRQAKRMHDMYNRGGYSCADCPLDCSDGRCMLDFDDKFKPEEVECYIMDWAAEHPGRCIRAGTRRGKICFRVR